MKTETLDQLKERAKELQCIYNVAERLKDYDQDLGKLFYSILEILPDGWQYPGICFGKVVFENQTYSTPGYSETRWKQSAEIIVDDNILGEIQVFYADNLGYKNPFLPEEQKLLNSISAKLGNYIFNRRLKHTLKAISENHTDDSIKAKYLTSSFDEHWRWRLKMVEKLAYKMDFEALGVKAIYIIGSVKEATAGPVSDIDLLVHFVGVEEQKQKLELWINGWSHALAEIVLQKTGHEQEEGIIDLHIITDEDIKKKTSYAVMIGNTNNSARLIRKRN